MSQRTRPWSGMSTEFSERLKELENTGHCKGYGFFQWKETHWVLLKKKKKILKLNLFTPTIILSFHLFKHIKKNPWVSSM